MTIPANLIGTLFKPSAVAAAVAAGDPYYSNVSLLLHGDGANGATNNTMINSSPIALTIYITNGTVAQGTYTPWSSDTTVAYSAATMGGSLYFNGSSYLNLTYPNNENAALGAGDFTIEFWINAPTGTSEKFIWGTRSGGGIFHITIGGYSGTAAGSLRWGSTNTATSAIICDNSWHHCAVVRQSGVVKMYVDGVLSASVNDTTNSGSTNGSFMMGTNDSSGAQGTGTLTGYISNFRIVKGTAVYTANFAPSTTPLTAITNTTLLLSGTEGSIIDSAKKNNLVTVGDVKISTTQKKFGTASMYFDGSGDYLSASNLSAFDFGTGDFTLESWIYLIDSTESYRIVIEIISPNNYLSLRIGDTGFGNTFQFITKYDANNSFTTGVSRQDFKNTWRHVAMTRQNGVLRCFIDGQQQPTSILGQSPGSGPTQRSFTDNITGTTKVLIGSGQSVGPWSGYIDELRVTKGTARYTANFTPPAAAFLDAEPVVPDTYYSNVSLLLHGDGVNGSTAMVDSSATSKTVSAVGNAQISTAQKKFGTGSMYFDGSGDYLTVPASSDFDFGTGDFTIEGWFNWTSIANGGLFHVYPGTPGGSTAGTAVGFDGTNFTIYTNGPYYGQGGSVTIGTWYHVAYVRSGGSVSLYINGVQQGPSRADATNYVTNGVNVGLYFSSGYTFPGYIDDFRITKGVARYTANFTISTKAFPNS